MNSKIPKSTKDLEPTLQEMRFRKYSVNGILYNVLDYKITDHTVEIVTDIKTFHIMHMKLQNMLNVFIEVADDLIPPMDEKEEIPEKPVVDTKYETVVSANDQPRIEALSGTAEVKNILMDNIRKLSKDRTYIHQAAAINDTVKTLIEVARTEIEAQELVIKMRSSMRTKTNLLS